MPGKLTLEKQESQSNEEVKAIDQLVRKLEDEVQKYNEKFDELCEFSTSENRREVGNRRYSRAQVT